MRVRTIKKCLDASIRLFTVAFGLRHYIAHRYNALAPVAEYGMALRRNLLVPGSIPGR